MIKRLTNPLAHFQSSKQTAVVFSETPLVFLLSTFKVQFSISIDLVQPFYSREPLSKNTHSLIKKGRDGRFGKGRSSLLTVELQFTAANEYLEVTGHPHLLPSSS